MRICQSVFERFAQFCDVPTNFFVIFVSFVHSGEAPAGSPLHTLFAKVTYEHGSILNLIPLHLITAALP